MAEVDFTNDLIESYQCAVGSVQGIDLGFANDDLVFEANVWNGTFGLGEFTVSGTSFDTTWSVCGAVNAITPDTGQLDFVTSDGAVLVHGHYAPQNNNLQVNVDSISYDLQTSPFLTASGTRWTLDLTGAGQSLSEGSHTVSVDVDGQLNLDSKTIVVDSAPPSVTIDSIDNDTGTSSTDFITTDDRILVFGTYSQTSNLEVVVAGVSYELETSSLLLSDGNGNWTLDLSSVRLDPGTTSIVATATDNASNSASDSRSVEIVTASIESISDDTGVVGDFITSVPQLSIAGTFTAGTNLSVEFDGAEYTVASPELTTAGSDWILDLSASALPFGSYEATVTVTDSVGNLFFETQLISIDSSCNVAESFELFDENGNPISSLGRVFIDGAGTPSVIVDLESRKRSTSDVFYVDDTAPTGGDGLTWASAFDDIHVAIASIKAMDVNAATINVASGNYVWGDTGSPGFHMNIIGAGPGSTFVQQSGSNIYAAQVRAKEVYIEGIAFTGGSTVMDIRNAPKVTVVNSEFSGSSGDDGINIINATSVVMYGSTSHHNYADGFSYTNPNGLPMEVLELFVNGSDNGLNQLWNSQGSTIHKTVKIVRVGSVFERNPTNISDVGNASSWNVGVTTSDPLANDQGGQYLNLNVSNTVVGWVIAGDHGGGLNTPSVVNAQPGSQIRYVEGFGTLSPTSHIVTGLSFVDNGPLVPVSTPCAADVTIDAVSQNSGDPTDFVTFDQEIVLSGTFQGIDLEVDFDGTSYDQSSSELTIDGLSWSLDLSQQVLPHGYYTVSATATDDQQVVATTVVDILIDCATPQHRLRENPVLDAIGNAEVYVDGNGIGTVLIDLDARKVPSANEFYVDAVFAGDGSVGNPFNDIPDALAHIDAMGFDDATIYVAEGDYSWGDILDPKYSPDFAASLNVIGAGSSATTVVQAENDNVAALYNEPGKSLYVEGVTFLGLGSSGTKNFNENTFDARNGKDLTFADVEFRSSTDGDGLFVIGYETVVVYDSKAINNDSDGFSYSNAGPSIMSVLEVNVVSASNGKDGDIESQGSTTHRITEIVRVNSLYSKNPTNIEDAGLTSWNVNLTVENPTKLGPEGDFLNFLVRGDKVEVNDGEAWLISGSYNSGGVVHAHSSNANGVPIYGNIHYSSLFDLASHPPSVLTSDFGATIFHPADDSELNIVSVPCSAPEVLLGAINKGIAVGDTETGEGYILHSAESVFSRFASNAPLNGNSDQLVAVRYQAGGWQYNNNDDWFSFVPAYGDRLIASVDYSADTIDSLLGVSGSVNGIQQGFIESDLTFYSDRWASKSNNGEFTVEGTYYLTAGSGEVFQVSPLNAGVAVEDLATGNGYMMFSPTSVHDRFSANPPHAQNSDHFIAVRNLNGLWEYNSNTGWFPFTSDRGRPTSSNHRL